MSWHQTLRSQVSRAPISFCHISKGHKLPQGPILGTWICLPKLSLSCLNGPPSTRAHLSSLCNVTQGGQSLQIFLMYVKAETAVNIWLLRVICLSASQSQVSYHIKSFKVSLAYPHPTFPLAIPWPVTQAQKNWIIMLLRHFCLQESLKKLTFWSSRVCWDWEEYFQCSSKPLLYRVAVLA